MNLDEKDIQGAFRYAYFFLKFRPRSKKELTTYLQKKSMKQRWTPHIVELVIERLGQEGLVDDAAFIEWFVAQRKSGKPKGEFVLRQELHRFAVPENLVDEYFLNNPLDEESQAYQALLRRWPRLKSFPREQRLQKAYGFLSRRGFVFDVIKKTIADIEEKEYNKNR